jgi:hypothetical protein
VKKAETKVGEKIKNIFGKLFFESQYFLSRQKKIGGSQNQKLPQTGS